MRNQISVTLATLERHNHIVGDIERGVKLYERGGVTFAKDINLGYIADIPEKGAHRRVVINFTDDGLDIESFFCNKCALRSSGAICRHVVAGILAIQGGVVQTTMDETIPPTPDAFTRTELEEARRSIESTLHKCEKALEKLKPGSPQWTLTDRRIKAFRLSMALIDRELECVKPPTCENELIANLDKLHTTELGISRMKRNLGLTDADVVTWCKQKTALADEIIRKGKNWYVYTDAAIITVNAHSYTIITAHKK